MSSTYSEADERREDLEDILTIIDLKQEQIRKSFLDPANKATFISYATFMKYFPLQSTNFKLQNSNIIDVHLRYHWWMREQMAPYKWIPIALMTPLLIKNIYLLVALPVITVKMFDHYFEKYFHWKYRNQKVINIRKQFSTKLSKMKNKIRRVRLYETLQKELKETTKDTPEIQKQTNLEATVESKEQKTATEMIKEEGPLKYIKFGQFTEYIFHAEVEDGKEQASILQTTLFESYLSFKNIFWALSRPSCIIDSLRQFKDSFLQYRRAPDRAQYLINTDGLTTRPQIKDIEVYTVDDNFDHNVRRWSELSMWMLKGSVEPSNFKLWQHTNFTQYIDIFEALRYNNKDNGADLAMYFGLMAVPKLLNWIFRRR